MLIAQDEKKLEMSLKASQQIVFILKKFITLFSALRRCFSLRTVSLLKHFLLCLKIPKKWIKELKVNDAIKLKVSSDFAMEFKCLV